MRHASPLVSLVAIIWHSLLEPVSAYVTRPRFSTALSPSFARYTESTLHATLPLEPEPDGGDELSASATMPGCRVKKMEEMPDIKSDDGVVHRFWMTAEVDGTLIKEIRTQILKDAAKKANFPGFRKGQVPPYAQPQITNFALQESIITTVQNVLQGYGLKSVSGSEGELNVNESVEEMTKLYKTVGDPIQFTGTINAVVDRESSVPAVGDTSSAIDTDAISEAD